MKTETVEAIATRIAQLELQETHLALTIQFPPSGCRSVTVWRQVQSDALGDVRRLLGEQREILARWCVVRPCVQLNLALPFTD